MWDKMNRNERFFGKTSVAITRRLILTSGYSCVIYYYYCYANFHKKKNWKKRNENEIWRCKQLFHQYLGMGTDLNVIDPSSLFIFSWFSLFLNVFSSGSSSSSLTCLTFSSYEHIRYAIICFRVFFSRFGYRGNHSF